MQAISSPPPEPQPRAEAVDAGEPGTSQASPGQEPDQGGETRPVEPGRPTPGRHSHTYIGAKLGIIRTPGDIIDSSAKVIHLPAAAPVSLVTPPPAVAPLVAIAPPADRIGTAPASAARDIGRPQRQSGQPRQTSEAPVRSLSGRGVGWVATHGGAGATTFAAVLGGTDLGCRWPDTARDEPARVLLLARTHDQGLRAASRALNSIREGRHPAGMQLVGLVLVADAPGRLPSALVSRIRLLRTIVPVHRVPWIVPWRLGKSTTDLPPQLLKVWQLVQSIEGAAVR